MTKVCRIDAAPGGSCMTMRPPSRELPALYAACRARGWSAPFVRYFPRGGVSEVTVDGPTPGEMADVLAALAGFDYAVTVG